MPKPNYKYAKRQKEIAKQKKKEEKMKRKLEKKPEEVQGVEKVEQVDVEQDSDPSVPVVKEESGQE